MKQTQLFSWPLSLVFSIILATTGMTAAHATSPNSVNEYLVDDYYSGSGDYTTAIQNCVNAAAAGKGIVVFTAGKTYETRWFWIDTDSAFQNSTWNQPPVGVMGNNATIMPPADANPSSTFVMLRNPHGAGNTGFFFRDLKILCKNGTKQAANGLVVHGAQDLDVENIQVSEASAAGIIVKGIVRNPLYPTDADAPTYADRGHGVYYSSFRNVRSDDNGGYGFKVHGTDGSVFPNYSGAWSTANVGFYNCSAQRNGGAGMWLDHASVTLTAFSAEKNAGWGVDARYIQSLDLLGGYYENNGGFTGSNGKSIILATGVYSSGGCRGVNVIGGRVIGQISYDSTNLTGSTIATAGKSRHEVYP